MASHFDLVTLVMSLAGGTLVRTQDSTDGQPARGLSATRDNGHHGDTVVLITQPDEKSIDEKIWTSVLTQSGR